MSSLKSPTSMHSIASDQPVISDEQLAVRARGGCRDSFGELARRFQVRLLRFLQRHVRSAADAEDLLQETLVRAFVRLNSYDESRPFSTWLFTLAHRLAVSHHRHAMAVQRASVGLARSLLGSDRPDTDPGRQLAEEEYRGRFWDTAQRVLSQDQFCAIWLFYVEQMPTQQIAEVMGRSWVAVKTNLFRARQKLAPLVAEGTERRPRSQPIFQERAAAYV